MAIGDGSVGASGVLLLGGVVGEGDGREGSEGDEDLHCMYIGQLGALF